MTSPTLRAWLNWWLVLGVALLILGTGPFVIGGLLSDAGLVNIGNGLGFGLLYTFTLPLAVLLIVIGLYVAIVRLIKTTGGAA